MSKYNYEFSQTYSDNPYIDILVNCTKILGANAVVKNENQALHYEDARSAILSADYIKYMNGAWDELHDGEYNPNDYFEYNSYYRMLNGLPPAYNQNDEKAYLVATGYSDDEVYEYVSGNTYVISELYRRYFIDLGKYDEAYEGRYLHELSNNELTIISVSGGILEQVKQDYGEDPNYQYIYHLGDKRVDFFTARTASNFALLFIPKLDRYRIVEDKFKRYYDRNRHYTEATIYSEAYKFMSYHYDNFIQMLIIIQTMVDIISEVQEYIINKDVLDSRTIRYLFESYGITYYKEIPIKYQIRIIKNVNKLIKYKSSHKNIMDILELFDDDSITVFTYYLMKIKKLNRDDFYYYEEKDINPFYITNKKVLYVGKPEDVENNKVPIMFVSSTQDNTEPVYDSKGKKVKENFIKTYLYNYQLANATLPDTFANRKIDVSYSQPITSKLVDTLPSLTDPSVSNGSFILDFLNVATFGVNKLPWFGMEKYNPNPELHESMEYMTNRNNYLIQLKTAFNSYISTALDKSGFALNKYNFRQIKYYVYGLLGIFDYSKTIDFETTSDVELESRFFMPDTLITESYCIDHDIPYDQYEYFIDSDDRYVLNHSVPFMVWNEYKSDLAYEGLNTDELYLFNSNKYIDATMSKLGDDYAKYTKYFREHYVVYTKMIVDAIFRDLEYDAVNNPSPRYDGWVDVGIVLKKLNVSLDKLTFDTPMYVEEGEDLAVYNTAFLYEEVTKDMIGTEVFRKNYDLCFLKVPVLDSNAYAVIENREARRSYDSVTLNDTFWDGISTYDLLTEEEKDTIHQSKKQEILSREFNVERTKYLAVEADIDLVKMSYQVSYFMNMLYDKYKDEESLMVEVDSEISGEKVRLNDLLTFAIALNFLYNGTEPDNIASDMEKNMYINGFNFDTDWTDIYNYLENKHFIGNNYKNDIHEYTYVDENGNQITNTGYGMDQFHHGWMTELYDDSVVYGYIRRDGKDVLLKAYFGQPIYGYDGNGNPIFPSDSGNYVVRYMIMEDEEEVSSSILAFPAYVYEDSESLVFTYDTEQNGDDPEEYVRPISSESGDSLSFSLSNEPINSRIPTPVDRTVIPDTKVGAFLSGRYEKTDVSTEEYDYNESEIWTYNLKNHTIINPDSTKVIDITWDNPYLDNNSHALWLDTGILNTIPEDASDLEKINKLKDIYTHNTNLYNHLTYMMNHAENKRMYDIYKILFDSFMETKMNHDYYTLIDDSGMTVYTNVNDTSELFYFKSKETVEQDEHGFPLFSGTNLTSGVNMTYRFNYQLAISTGFSKCHYVSTTTSAGYDCIKNQVGDYIVFYNDDRLNLTRNTYFFPVNENMYFEVKTNITHWLEDSQDSKIIIPINLDDDGNPIIESGYKYVVKTNADGSYITDASGNYVIVKVPVSDETTIGKQIILTNKISDNYYDFLQFRNPSLYAHLIDLKYNYKNLQVTDSTGDTMYTPSEEKRNRIETLCEYIASALEQYFKKDEWIYLFNIIPTANIQNIQSYIMKMVIFFKSWKTQVLNSSVNYSIDDGYNNKVRILDDAYHNSTYQVIEKMGPKDYKYFDVHTVWQDKINLMDKVDIQQVDFEKYKVDFGFGEKMYGNNFDYPEFVSKLTFKDKTSPDDDVELKLVTFTGEVVQDDKGNLLLP